MNRYERDRGGKLPHGLQEVVNNTDQPENIIKPPWDEAPNNDDLD